MSIPNQSSYNASPIATNPFGTNPSLASMTQTSGPFPYMPPASPPAAAGPAMPQPGEVVLEITRLLDMPMQEKMFSDDLKQYRVRAYDDYNQEIGRTKELAGIPENFGSMEDADTETIRLAGEGILRVQTQSPVIHLQVEYAGAFLGNMKIGRCRIARSDQRSREIWPYALSNKNGELVGCGIELKLREGGPVPMAGPPPSAGALPGSMGPSFQTMPPMGSGTPPMPAPPGSMGPSFQTMPPMGSGTPPMGPMGTMGPSMPPVSVPMMPPMGSMGPGMPPGSGPLQPSFQTIPPFAMQDGKGKGKGLPPVDGPQPFWGTPPMPPGGQPSFNTMPPQTMQPSFNTMPQLQPQMFPNFNQHNGLAVKSAMQGRRDVTTLLNQLIHANGLADPTRGATIAQIFGSDEEMVVYGPDVMQREGPRGGTFPKEIPMVFLKGSAPAYDMRPLFMGQIPATGTFHAPGGFPVSVVAIIDLEKIIDIPAPAGGGDGDVTLTLERVQGGKVLASAGPFKTVAQGVGGLRKVDDCKGKLATRATMEDLAKGSVEFRVSAHYKGSWYKFGSQAYIGSTAPFSVSWRPESSQYAPIFTEPGKNSPPKPVGGIYLSHRFAQDSEELYKSMNGPKVAPEKDTNVAAPDKDVSDVNGVTGKFKKGSQDEVFEYAALAVEGQNRALHQRINMAKSAKQMNTEYQNAQADDSALFWRLPSHYRDWKDLDSLFITLGPNYVAQSSEVGVNICRVYEEKNSIWKELIRKASPEGLGVPENPADEAKMKELLRSMTKSDPDIILSTLRPIVAKDVASIQRDGLTDVQKKPVLKVRVHSATNLRTKAGFLHGAVQPRVVIDIPGKRSSKWESQPCPDSQHVEWNQEGVVKDYSYGDDIRVMVVDKNFVGFEDHLGEARLPGSDFYPEAFFAQLPLLNADKLKGNSSPAAGAKGASILIEVEVIEPMGKSEMWPPFPPMYAPVSNLNESDQETQRLANWDIHQNAKLAFVDASPNYQMNEDIWGAMHTNKHVAESNVIIDRDDWRAPRVKDECLMA